MIHIKIILLSLTMLMFQLATAQEHFKKIPDKSTDTIKIALATQIAASYFESLKKGDYFDIQDMGTKEFIEKMTPEIQKQSYEQIRQLFGDFKSLTYSGIWISKDNSELEVIRFKGEFEKSEKPLEIRVVINQQNMVSGFWIKPWQDNLNDP